MSAADYNAASALDYASPGCQVIKAVERGSATVARIDRAVRRRARQRPEPQSRIGRVFDAVERAMGGEPL